MVLNSNVDLYGVGSVSNPNRLVKRNLNKRFGFRYPMGDIDSGTFLKKSSDLELVKGQLRQLLLTNRGERVMLPGFGTNLRKYIMEPLDQATLSQVRREILESFRRYAPNVSISKLQVFPGTTSTLNGGNFIRIVMYCTLLDVEEVSFELNVDLL
jgi:phage baseplate assembly protein W